jgi:hypothetical protein
LKKGWDFEKSKHPACGILLPHIIWKMEPICVIINLYLDIQVQKLLKPTHKTLPKVWKNKITLG